jgi:hypothetical protein
MKIGTTATAIWAVMAGSAAFGAIPLNSPTTDWTAVPYVGAARTDYLDDEQTGINESDLVGSAPGAAALQTAFYFDFDGVSIGFRVRVDGDSNPPGYTGAIWVGLMLGTNDDTVDLFAGVINKGPTSQIGFYKPGPGANVSPSTTTIVDGSPLYAENISASNFLWTAVTVGPSGNDPVPGGTANISSGGSKGDKDNDYFATWVLPFSQLQAAAASLPNGGFTVTSSTPIRFVVGTSEQANSMNQDLNGTSGNTTSASTFATLGAVSPVVTASGGVVPEPAVVGLVAVAVPLVFGMRRRR